VSKIKKNQDISKKYFVSFDLKQERGKESEQRREEKRGYGLGFRD